MFDRFKHLFKGKPYRLKDRNNDEEEHSEFYVVRRKQLLHPRTDLFVLTGAQQTLGWIFLSHITGAKTTKYFIASGC